MPESEVPPAPSGLGAAGVQLWTSVVDDFELSQHETDLLPQACYILESLEQLQAVVDAEGVVTESPHGRKANVALVEARAQRLVLAKLLAQLKLPAGAPAGTIGDNRCGNRRRPGLISMVAAKPDRPE